MKRVQGRVKCSLSRDNIYNVAVLFVFIFTVAHCQLVQVPFIQMLDWDVELDWKVGEVHRVVTVRQDWSKLLSKVTVDVVRNGRLVVCQTHPEKRPAPGRAPGPGPHPRATVPISVHTILILKPL